MLLDGEKEEEEPVTTGKVGNRVHQGDAEKVVQVTSFSPYVLSSFRKKRRNDGGASQSDAARGTWSQKGLKSCVMWLRGINVSVFCYATLRALDTE